MVIWVRTRVRIINSDREKLNKPLNVMRNLLASAVLYQIWQVNEKISETPNYYGTIAAYNIQR
jgi:hypothetical protein